MHEKKTPICIKYTLSKHKFYPGILCLMIDLQCTCRCSQNCPSAKRAALRTVGSGSFRPLTTHCRRACRCLKDKNETIGAWISYINLIQTGRPIYHKSLLVQNILTCTYYCIASYYSGVLILASQTKLPK